MVYFQYSSMQEARNRKFILALITYSFRIQNFARSQNIIPNEQSTSINQIIDNTFMLVPVPGEDDSKVKEQV